MKSHFGVLQDCAALEKAVGLFVSKGYPIISIVILMSGTVRPVGIIRSLPAFTGIAIPGIGPFYASGEIGSYLVTSQGKGDRIAWAFHLCGLLEADAVRYQNAVLAGKAVIVVFCWDDRFSQKTKGLLAQSGAEDILEG